MYSMNVKLPKNSYILSSG